MKTFYVMLLFFAEFDLAIARSTGRNPANIGQLQDEVHKWQKCLWDLEMNCDN